MSASDSSADSPATSISDNHERVDSGEFASAKLWAVYISEAEKYDKALVEGWKSDMEGLLIFYSTPQAGLFSASLVAFIVESYKTLSPDQGEITVALLTQISRQLDPKLNASFVDVSSLTASTPVASSLASRGLEISDRAHSDRHVTQCDGRL
ncbi:hypothetical protein C8R43DRAFT_954388 [Mycena crocata]|nr:hypothetical protein C8R43DRAFT_954388 [Mycena crocata]